MNPGDVISYREMCDAEGVQTLQRGMNFRLAPTHSVVLMSRRANAPYVDQLEGEGAVLIYEGHDEPRTASCQVPKVVDQPLNTKSGTLTQNGKFYQAAEDHGPTSNAEPVRVYEKIQSGIWVYNGTFLLRSAWLEEDNSRMVCKFRLEITELHVESNSNRSVSLEHTRMIPSDVKLEVWKRDGGKCRICRDEKNLHYDHILPYSKGGTSLRAENIQLLCAKHNLAKSDRIE